MSFDYENFRSGFVAIIGRPNVGKSTLVNALIGQKVAPVTPKAQTTRRRQLGILTTGTYQICFVDTPGIHTPRQKLGKFLNQEAAESIPGVDAVLFLVDVSVEPTDEDKWIAMRLSKLARRIPLVLVSNKIDLVPAEALTPSMEAYQALIPDDALMVPISATKGEGTDSLVEALVPLLPIRFPDYHPDQVTDLYEREIEEMSGRKVFLELRVKVLKEWRKDEQAMRRLGYSIKKKKGKQR